MPPSPRMRRSRRCWALPEQRAQCKSSRHGPTGLAEAACCAWRRGQAAVAPCGARFGRMDATAPVKAAGSSSGAHKPSVQGARQRWTAPCRARVPGGIEAHQRAVHGFTVGHPSRRTAVQSRRRPACAACIPAQRTRWTACSRRCSRRASRRSELAVFGAKPAAVRRDKIRAWREPQAFRGKQASNASTSTRVPGSMASFASSTSTAQRRRTGMPKTTSTAQLDAHYRVASATSSARDGEGGACRDPRKEGTRARPFARGTDDHLPAESGLRITEQRIEMLHLYENMALRNRISRPYHAAARDFCEKSPLDLGTRKVVLFVTLL